MILNNKPIQGKDPHEFKSWFTRPDHIRDTLYVVTPVFNPRRYRSRWKLYKEFETYVLNNKQAHLVTIECIFGERDAALVEDMGDNHTVITVRTPHEIWIKENLINLAITRLPADWQYVAWIDADIKFARPDWVGETLHRLQHYQFIQMFSQAVDLSPSFEIIKTHTGFVYCHSNGVPNMNKRMAYPYYPEGGAYWHPGFAWAARREAINSCGGLVDWSILGGGDMFMAYALVGQLNDKTMPNSLGENGVRLLAEWQNRAEKFVQRNVGYMEGTILHYWHGKKRDRKYNDRGQILVSEKFDPELDLKKDWQGLYQLTDRSFKLRDGVREYMAGRNEDSIDLE